MTAPSRKAARRTFIPSTKTATDKTGTHLSGGGQHVLRQAGFAPPSRLPLPPHGRIDQRRDQDQRALEHVLIGL